MSRIGRLPIALPDKVTASMSGDTITVSGPLGALTQKIANSDIEVNVSEKEITVTRKNDKGNQSRPRALQVFDSQYGIRVEKVIPRI